MTQSNSKNSYFNAASKLAIVSMVSFAVFFSCKNKEEKHDKNDMEEPMSEQTNREEIASTSQLEMGCYMYKREDNMVNFEITKNENPVEGNLTYALAKKDKNTGTFRGEINEGKLVGIYTFMSEGVQSKRQVAYLLKDKRLIEADGELNDDGNMFKDLKTVSYTSEMSLNKTDCQQ